MKDTQNSETDRNKTEDLLPEYNFDYSKASPNRFAAEAKEKTITITLEPDIAQVFKTSEQVNSALRAILTAIPKK